ncbi:unnamed protein product [Lymnaea stagnalis]|uniref:Uncharacterized protein n=1 Tax=Lymnaea stagnalis TaxID=6523 RepID=A0AAV2HZG5_LYMST
MASPVAENIPDRLMNDVWEVMHLVATMDLTSSTSRSRNDFQFECDGDEDLDSERKKMAETLVKMGDSMAERYNKQSDEDILVQEISDYLGKKADEINSLLGPGFTKFDPRNVIYKTPVWGSIYGAFKSKLEQFLGFDDISDQTQIALVSSVTKGVAKSFQESSSQSVNLVTTLSTYYITEKYGQKLKDFRSLAPLQ